MKRNAQCPDCKIAMELGFIPDDVGGNYTRVGWHPGEPGGRNWMLGMKLSKDKMKRMEAFRCPTCGQVETQRMRLLPRR